VRRAGDHLALRLALDILKLLALLLDPPLRVGGVPAISRRQSIGRGFPPTEVGT